MSKTTPLFNYINGQWKKSATSEYLVVENPATSEKLHQVPLSTGLDVEEAVAAAKQAFPDWRRTPPTERIQYLFRFKNLLEEHFESIAEAITLECGKTLPESRGELRRGIENVEVATGIPTLLMGSNLEDIASGIDEFMIRQPIGVTAAIVPFNFPAMIPLWFLPYAIACGNTFLLKPSEKVPLTMDRVFDLLDQIKMPKGVVGLINGSNEAVDALLDHPDVRAISFVGSSPVAKYVYSRAAAKGKRVQAQGGAKNPVVILPDADMESTTQVVTDSAFGCAGQRCLATSVAITIGEASEPFKQSILGAVSSRRVGNGLDPDVQMGPVISSESRQRIESLITEGLDQGALPLLDGRGRRVADDQNGHFLFPTVLDTVNPNSQLAQTEVFGPVLSLTQADSLQDAIEMINSSGYGNMACLFTGSGRSARQFRYQVEAGNVGINVGVAAPMAFFPFSGWKNSFYGDLHGQGQDAINFFTEKKVVVERWPKEWSRKF